MALHGAWRDAMYEAEQASERFLRGPDHPAAGAAFYQQAELHRLRGEFAKAEDAYRQASRWGREPQPGLARLRLAQGQVDTAQAAIRRAADAGPRDSVQSASRLCRDHACRTRCRSGTCRRGRAVGNGWGPQRCWVRRPPPHREPCSWARATHEPPYRHCALRGRPGRSWRRAYEAARVRVLVGLACRELGDQEGSELELDAARGVFQLGAAPDLARVQALSQTKAAKRAG